MLKHVQLCIFFKISAVQESKELSAKFRALYEDLYCDEENNDIINAKINVNVELFLEELPCRQKMTCDTTDFVILNCGKEPTRKKRSPDPSKMTAGFQVKFSCSAMTRTLPNIDITYRFYS